MKGRLIIFEGPDGCGKSTMASMIFEYLSSRGDNPLFLREPGGTYNGEKIRELALRSKEPVRPKTEGYLMAAARAELVDLEIRPALEQARTILLDRSVISSMVYQGYARGLGVERVRELNQLAIESIPVDLCLYYRLSFKQAQARRTQRGIEDNIEKEDLIFHEKIHEGYEFVFNKYKDIFRMVPVDGSKSIEEVFKSSLHIINGG